MEDAEQINVEICLAGEWTADGEALLEARRELVQLRAEVARLRLTEAEREALHWVCGDVADISGPTEDTLRGLIERTNHDAVPAAIAQTDDGSVGTDKAEPLPVAGTGNTPVAACSVAERPLGDPEIAVEILRLRVAELEEAIRRLAEQDALLSVCDGNVTVTLDAALTDAEREAVEWAAFEFDGLRPDNGKAAERAATLRALLERTK